MALKKPLVLSSSGIVQQLQAGDTLDAPTDQTQQIIQTNANAGTLVPGTPVYSSANDSVDKAKADASATVTVLGLTATSIATGATGPIATNGVLALTTAQWDAAFGTSGGLTKNVNYFLSASTAGQGTSTVTTTVGQYVALLGTAISTTELLIRPAPPILL